MARAGRSAYAKVSCQDAIQTFALELAEFYLPLSTSAEGRCDKESLELYKI